MASFYNASPSAGAYGHRQLVGLHSERGARAAVLHEGVLLAVNVKDRHAVLARHALLIARGAVGEEQQQQATAVGCIGGHHLQSLVQGRDVCGARARTASRAEWRGSRWMAHIFRAIVVRGVRLRASSGKLASR